MLVNLNLKKAIKTSTILEKCAILLNLATPINIYLINVFAARDKGHSSKHAVHLFQYFRYPRKKHSLL